MRHQTPLKNICVFLTALIGALHSCYGFAITNIEDERINPKVEGWTGQIEFSIEGKSGNSDKQNTSFGAKAIHRKNNHTVLMIAESEYGESFDQKDTNSNFAHLRFVQRLTERLATEEYLQYQDDEFKSLDARSLVGSGIRYLLTPQQKHLQLNLGAGVYYTLEKWNLSSSQLEEDYTRASFYISYKHQLTDSVFLLDTLYYQPRMSQPSDMYVFNQFSIQVKIIDSLALKFSLKTHYDSEPVDDLDKTDQSYNSSLVYSF